MNNTSPFTKEKKYEVITSISELGHNFKVGEVVVYKTFSYDAHNGVTRFWFAKNEENDLYVWHVWDTDKPAFEQWMKYFKER
jgi:hypothetical protein